MNRFVWSMAATIVLVLSGCMSRAPVATVQELSALPDSSQLEIMSDDAFASWLDVERQTLEHERALAQQRYDKQEPLCWQSFAVNDCLRAARRARYRRMAALRDRDLALNQHMRARRTARRLQSIADKSAEK